MPKCGGYTVASCNVSSAITLKLYMCFCTRSNLVLRSAGPPCLGCHRNALTNLVQEGIIKPSRKCGRGGRTGYWHAFVNRRLANNHTKSANSLSRSLQNPRSDVDLVKSQRKMRLGGGTYICQTPGAGNQRECTGMATHFWKIWWWTVGI